MGRQVTIRSGYARVRLPDGRAYSAGQTAVLTDGEWGSVSEAVLATIDPDSIVTIDDPAPREDDQTVDLLIDTDGAPYLRL